MPCRAVLAILFLLTVSLHESAAAAAANDFSDYDDLNGAVLSCEEAVAALAECCPGFEPQRVRCVDHRYRQTSACTGSVTEGHELPALDVATSECVRAMSCADLVAGSTCARAPLKYARLTATDAGVPSTLPGACL